MKMLFYMDPLETVQPDKDTTLMLMLGAHRKGHAVYYLPETGITSLNGRIQFYATPVVPDLSQSPPFVIGAPEKLEAEVVDVVFIRKDPPFDAQYVYNTWLLDRLPENIFVTNAPSGIRTVNEKIWATQFTDWVPPTLVTQALDQAETFLQTHAHVIAKPTDGFGGQGIVKLDAGPQALSFLQNMLQAGKAVILQPFLPEAAKGDKRILLLDGEPLGAVLRLQAGQDHRHNLMTGGQPHPAQVTENDKKIIAVLKPHLKKLGLHFVGIDVIGDYLIEVNVTSPTCLQEINRIEDKTLEDDVIAFVEKEVQARQCLR